MHTYMSSLHRAPVIHIVFATKSLGQGINLGRREPHSTPDIQGHSHTSTPLSEAIVQDYGLKMRCGASAARNPEMSRLGPGVD